jgi:hypothetical protein
LDEFLGEGEWYHGIHETGTGEITHFQAFFRGFVLS